MPRLSDNPRTAAKTAPRLGMAAEASCLPGIFAMTVVKREKEIAADVKHHTQVSPSNLVANNHLHWK